MNTPVCVSAIDEGIEVEASCSGTDESSPSEDTLNDKNAQHQNVKVIQADFMVYLMYNFLTRPFIFKEEHLNCVLLFLLKVLYYK